MTVNLSINIEGKEVELKYDISSVQDIDTILWDARIELRKQLLERSGDNGR